MYGIRDTYREPADKWRNNQPWPMSVWMPPGSRWAAGEPLTLTWVTEGEGVRMPVFLEVTLSVGVGIHQSYIWDIWPTSIGVWIPKVCRPPLPRPHAHTWNGYKANIHSRHLLYHDSWVKFKVFVLNNKNMTVNGSMSCHNITAFRIHPTLCFPVLRNTKSAGLKIFWHFWYAKHVYYA